MKQAVILLIFAFLQQCASMGGVGSKGKDAEYQIIKPNTRVDKFKDTWNMKGEGPVKLDCSGKPCSDADISALKPDQIKALKKDGEWKEYVEKEDENKKKFAVLNTSGLYTDGNKEGTWIFWGEKGEKLREVPYVKGKKNGVEKKYNLKTGTQTEEITWVDDKKNGKYWKKKPDGLMDMEGQYENDLKTGVWTDYYAKDGKDMVKESVSEYSKDKKNGKETNYHPDGSTVRSEGSYKDGLKSGAWKTHYDNGAIETEGGYAPKEAPLEKGEVKPEPPKEGERAKEVKAFRMGLWKEYFKSGKLFAEGKREHTRKGEWKFYDNKGTLRYKGVMANEAGMESAEIYDEKGEIIGKGKLFFSLMKIDPATDDLKVSSKPNKPYTYYKNGKKVLEIKDEDKEGNIIAIEYDESGAKLGEGPMVMSSPPKKNGCWTMAKGKTMFVMDKPNQKMGEMQGCR